ncbi:MAG: 6-phosphofructokinase [Flavobacteriales bacterium]
MKKIQKIGVYTSGGDAPGMNAAIRAVVRSSVYYGLSVSGIYRGYEGMIENDIVDIMDVRSVNQILQKGGTMLESARCAEFRTPEGRTKAYRNLKTRQIDALVAIGGDGTFTGASLLAAEHGVPIIGIPGTIDNDLNGTDFTIGFDTATNTAIAAVDNIRNTAMSHNRLFFVEVMGRNSGFIAANTGLASGAIDILIPEREGSIDAICEKLEKGRQRKKTSSIVIVAEGCKLGHAQQIADQVSARLKDYDTKVTILGHIQRGGDPTSFDRILASRLGVAAVEGLIAGRKDEMVGIIKNQVVYTPFEEAIREGHHIDEEGLRVADILSI